MRVDGARLELDLDEPERRLRRHPARGDQAAVDARDLCVGRQRARLADGADALAADDEHPSGDDLAVTRPYGCVRPGTYGLLRVRARRQGETGGTDQRG